MNSSSASIRQAVLNDAEEMTRLCNELGYRVTGSDIEARLSALQKTGRHFIAVAASNDTSLVGWIAAEQRTLLESGERAEIVGLVVDGNARRTGIGRKLVSAVEAWAVDRGLSRVFVRSNVKRNASHHFYNGIGYDRSKTQHAYSKSIKG